MSCVAGSVRSGAGPGPGPGLREARRTLVLGLNHHSPQANWGQDVCYLIPHNSRQPEEHPHIVIQNEQLCFLWKPKGLQFTHPQDLSFLCIHACDILWWNIAKKSRRHCGSGWTSMESFEIFWIFKCIAMAFGALGGWSNRVLFPKQRLVHECGKGPRRCSWCSVSWVAPKIGRKSQVLFVVFYRVEHGWTS